MLVQWGNVRRPLSRNNLILLSTQGGGLSTLTNSLINAVCIKVACVNVVKNKGDCKVKDGRKYT